MGGPISAARFSISIDGYEIGSFSELAGISLEMETVDYVPSGGNETILLDRFAVRRTHTAIKLVRPRSTDPRIGAWHLAARRNRAASLKSCALRMYDRQGKPVARYHLEQAWPSKIDIGGLTGGPGRSGQSETVTFTCESIHRV